MSSDISSFTEKHRPQFHFTPPAHWMNDPNGLVFFEGEYHLFYQFYPDSNVWGPMHWGHAVSSDLVHWEHLPIALYPDSLGYIFSGSAVVDWNNTSGFGENGKPPLIAIYTYHDPAGEKEGNTNYQSQAIAYSSDHGRTWTKYEKNPVIPNSGDWKDFRDPKVFWHTASEKWILVLAANDHIKIYGSKDLKSWQHLSDWGKEYGTHEGVWECPDLFELKVDGSDDRKWVLIQNINPGGRNGGSGTQYFIGSFDGIKFELDSAFAHEVTDNRAIWLDEGRDNYAGVTWSDIPSSDGRRLFIGWMSNWEYAQKVPTEVWRSAMTIPRALTLKKTEVGYRLTSNPVAELRVLRSDSVILESKVLEGESDISAALHFPPSMMELILDIRTGTMETDFAIVLFNDRGEEYRIGFDGAKNQFYSDRTRAGDASFSEKFATKIYSTERMSKDKQIHFHLFFDVSSVELFADHGAQCMTEIFFPSEDFSKVKLIASKGKVEIAEGKVYELEGIWELGDPSAPRSPSASADRK